MKLFPFLFVLSLAGCSTTPAPVVFRDDLDRCFVYQWNQVQRVDEIYCTFSNIPRKQHYYRKETPV